MGGSVSLPGQGVSLIPGTPGEGTVTEIVAGAGLNGGAITTEGTISAIDVGTGTSTATAGAATLNEPAGVITSEALVGATTYALTLTDSFIKSTSVIIVSAENSAGLVTWLVSVVCSNGSAVITVGMAALTGTVKINFTVRN